MAVMRSIVCSRWYLNAHAHSTQDRYYKLAERDIQKDTVLGGRHVRLPQRPAVTEHTKSASVGRLADRLLLHPRRTGEKT